MKRNTNQLIDRVFKRVSTGLIHCRISGDRQSLNRPIFLLHASPASSQSLESLIAALARDRFVIAPDTPGNGDSDAANSDHPDMTYYGNILLELAEEFRLSEFDIYGHHTGSHIGIEAAIKSPKKIKHLILDGVAILTKEERKEFLENYAPPQKMQPNGGQFHWAWNYMRDQMIFAPHFRKDADHLRTGGNFSASVLHDLTLGLLKNIETYHLTYNAVFNHDVRQRLPLLTTKTLVLTEEHSTLDKNTETVAKLIPLAERHRVEPSKVEGEDFEKVKANVIRRFIDS